jgi:hypothetical protein
VFIRSISPAVVNAALKQLRGPLGTVKTKSAVFTMFRCLVLATKVREEMKRITQYTHIDTSNNLNMYVITYEHQREYNTYVTRM